MNGRGRANEVGIVTVPGRHGLCSPVPSSNLTVANALIDRGRLWICCQFSTFVCLTLNLFPRFTVAAVVPVASVMRATLSCVQVCKRLAVSARRREQQTASPTRTRGE